jgi:SARP family transcriptional regulator, regulator of embCAB operon
LIKRSNCSLVAFTADTELDAYRRPKQTGRGLSVSLSTLRIGVLGPIAIEVDAAPIEIHAPKQRALLALLALRAGYVVSAAQLIDGLWGDEPPRSASKTLQTYVSGLRRALPEGAIQTHANSYELMMAPDNLDATRFEMVMASAQSARDTGDLDSAVEHVHTALSLWRGPALLDLRDELTGIAAAQRLDELRRLAVEDLADLNLELGAHQSIIAELELAVTTEPLRERRWAQLMVGLYRSGRQADALRAYRRLSDILGDELGIEPSGELLALEQSILLQSPDLNWQPTTMAKNSSGNELRTGLQRTVGIEGSRPTGACLTFDDGARIGIPPRGLRVGRAPDNDLVLEDEKASRYHASVVIRGAVFLVADLHSTNGTKVGSEGLVGSRPLQDGDVITIGSTALRFSLDGS